MTQRDFGNFNRAINPGADLVTTQDGSVRIGGIDLAAFAKDAAGNVTGLVGPGGEVLSLGTGVAAVPAEVEPADWWPDRYFAADTQYLYGHDAANSLTFVRVDKSSRARTAVANPFGVSAPRAIRTVWVSPSVRGLVLAVVGESSQTAASMVVWRSTDYGDTWSNVLTLGTGVGGTINGVWCLSDRNICEVAGILYLGEYNVNSSRVDGGTNDLVTLWKSVDSGATWFAALRWNQGSHVVRHIHALKPTPGGKIVICTGDTDAESAIVLWDAVTDISNTAWSALPAHVPAKYGSQRYRVVDADFRNGYMWWMSDGSTENTSASSEVGWFKMPQDFSEAATRLDGKISAIQGCSIYYTATLSNGAACYIEEITSTPVAGKFNLGIWTTNETRTRIERNGIQQISTAMTGQLAPVMFQYGDTVYVSFLQHVLGKGGVAGTAAFRLSATKRWCEVRPDVVHPVYWIDPINGVDNADSGRGWYPGLPWKTLNYALQAGRVTQGGRVMLPAGDFEETLTATTVIVTDQVNAETAGYVTIDGAGMAYTKHSLSAASSVAATYSLNGAASRVEFKDLWVSTKRAVSTQAIYTGGGATGARALRTIRARLGGRDIGALQNVICNLNVGAGGAITLEAYDSQFVAVQVGAQYLFMGDTDGPHNITAYRCVFDGARGAFNPTSTDTITCTDSLFVNFTVAAIRAAATATKVPTLKNCRFSSLYGLPQWIDDGALSEAGQWTGARSINALSPSTIFDVTSVVDAGAAPRDPIGFDYAESE